MGLRRLTVQLRQASARHSARHGHGKSKLLTVLIIGLVLFFLITAGLEMQPLLTKMATARVSNLVTQSINSVVTQKMMEGEIDYDKLISFEKDSNGQITALRSNMVVINRLQAEVVSALIQKISALDTTDLSIPVGNLVGNSLFSGRGPRIPIRILSVSSASAVFANRFTSAGINQTRQQIVLEVKVQISILVPGYTTSTTVESQVNVAETIIVGSVPSSYTYFSNESDLNQAANDYFNMK